MKIYKNKKDKYIYQTINKNKTPFNMDITLLQEPHNIKPGNNVVIFERTNPSDTYNGIVTHILNLPVNKYIKPLNQIYVDYFYVKFDIKIYNKLLKRGLNIIYNNKPEILGNIIYNHKTQHIQKIYIQHDAQSDAQRDETEIKLENINSMLIWRVAYKINLA
jgi:hypothetical protein